MRPTIIIAVACGMAVPTTAQTVAAGAFTTDTDPLRCKRKNPRGKLFSKRICRTSSEWALAAGQALDIGNRGAASTDTLPVGAVSFR